MRVQYYSMAISLTNQASITVVWSALVPPSPASQLWPHHREAEGTLIKLGWYKWERNTLFSSTEEERSRCCGNRVTPLVHGCTSVAQSWNYIKHCPFFKNKSMQPNKTTLLRTFTFWINYVFFLFPNLWFSVCLTKMQQSNGTFICHLYLAKTWVHTRVLVNLESYAN